MDKERLSPLAMLSKHRTSSMVSLPNKQVELMSTRYKYVHAVILWFCYFSLVS